MISIDRVYRTLLTIANSDVRGNVRPDELRLLVNSSVEEIVEDYFYELNRLLSREHTGHIGVGLENLPDRIREKILYFLKDRLVVKIGGYFPVPNDLRYIDSIFSSVKPDLVTNVGEVDEGLDFLERRLEECKSRREFDAIKNTVGCDDFPIYLQTSSGFLVYPDTIEAIRISYIRKHKIANWTFNVIGGNEVFNPSASDFQDIDLHPSEEGKIILKTLEKIGINLKEQDLQAISLNKEAQEFNKKNVR